jgi:hypothetical protein
MNVYIPTIQILSKKLHTKTKGCHIRPRVPLGFVTRTVCLRKKQILMYRRGDLVPSPPQVLTDYWRGRSKDQSDFYRSKSIFVISHIVLVYVPIPRSAAWMEGVDDWMEGVDNTSVSIISKHMPPLQRTGPARHGTTTGRHGLVPVLP